MPDREKAQARGKCNNTKKHADIKGAAADEVEEFIEYKGE